MKLILAFFIGQRLLVGLLPGHGPAQIIGHIVAAGSPQLHFFSIHVNLVDIRAVPAAVMNLPEADSLFIDLDHLPVHSQSGAQGIQVGMLRVPLLRGLHRNGDLLRFCQFRRLCQELQGLIPLLLQFFIGFPGILARLAGCFVVIEVIPVLLQQACGFPDQFRQVFSAPRSPFQKREYPPPPGFPRPEAPRTAPRRRKPAQAGPSPPDPR